jgi:hypothetical protein
VYMYEAEVELKGKKPEKLPTGCIYLFRWNDKYAKIMWVTKKPSYVAYEGFFRFFAPSPVSEPNEITS